MKRLIAAFAVLAVLFVIGCGPKAEEPKPATPTTPATPTAPDTAKKDTTVQAPPTTPPATPPTTPPATPPAKPPAPGR